MEGKTKDRNGLSEIWVDIQLMAAKEPLGVCVERWNKSKNWLIKGCKDEGVPGLIDTSGLSGRTTCTLYPS